MTSNKQEALHYLAKHSEDFLSLRTERGSEYQCPFYYMTPGEKLIPHAIKHLSEGYKLIFAPSLDTKGCLAFGNIKLGESEDVIEFVLGEGKCRELDSHPKLQTIIIDSGRMIAVNNKDYPGKAYIINSVYKIVKDVAYDLIPCVMEWSYYDRPVGKLDNNLIFWEIR